MGGHAELLELLGTELLEVEVLGFKSFRILNLEGFF